MSVLVVGEGFADGWVFGELGGGDVGGGLVPFALFGEGEDEADGVSEGVVGELRREGFVVG